VSALWMTRGRSDLATDIAGGLSWADFVAKLDDKRLARNNRIVAHKFLNQHCALASALESILLVLAPN
jgi:hypothetical protein